MNITISSKDSDCSHESQEEITQEQKKLVARMNNKDIGCLDTFYQEKEKMEKIIQAREKNSIQLITALSL